jgi:hypothetical protein
MKRPFANVGFTSGCIHGETFHSLLVDITHATIQLMNGFKMSVCSSYQTRIRFFERSFEVSPLPTNSLMYFDGTYIALGTFTSCRSSRDRFVGSNSVLQSVAHIYLKPLSPSMRGRPPKRFRIGLRCIQLFVRHPWGCHTTWLQRGNRKAMVARV